MPLLPWIWRSYLRTALVPLLLIELVLVAAYLLTNDAVREKNVEALRAVATERMSAEVALRAEIIGTQLDGVAHATDLFRWRLEQVLLDDAPVPEGRLGNLARSAGGAHYTSHDDGRFAAIYSAITEVGDAERAKLARLYDVDPFMRKILASHEDVVQVYFNSFDSLNIIRPYFDVLAQYDEHIDIPTYNFYYLADAEHNPERGMVWTDMYVDPAGQGWMSSSIAPVYRRDFLEGVVGLDVTVKNTVQRIEALQVPWQGYALLLDGNGTIMAMPPAAERDWGLSELTDYHYAEAVKSDTFKPDAFNIVKREDSGVWGREVMQQMQGHRVVHFGDARMIAWSTIPQTGWKLLMVVPEAGIYEEADALRDQIRDLGLLMLAALVVFYLFFFAFLFYRSRRMVRQLAEPLLDISRMVGAIAKGQFEHRPARIGLYEIDAAASNVAGLGQELGEQLAKRESAERALAEVNATLEERIEQRTQALEAEVRHSRELEGELRRMAEYDPLTGLPNRRLFEDRLQQAAARTMRTGNPIAVLFIDLDKFKPVNDRWGHESGDELLAAVAGRLRECVRAADTVARFGGDEFCALLVDVGDRDAIERVARKMLSRVAAPFDLEKGEVRISASIGAAIYPQGERRWEDLLHTADSAMYEAKRADRDGFAWAMEPALSDGG